MRKAYHIFLTVLLVLNTHSAFADESRENRERLTQSDYYGSFYKDVKSVQPAIRGLADSYKKPLPISREELLEIVKDIFEGQLLSRTEIMVHDENITHANGRPFDKLHVTFYFGDDSHYLGKSKKNIDVLSLAVTELRMNRNYKTYVNYLPPKIFSVSQEPEEFRQSIKQILSRYISQNTACNLLKGNGLKCNTGF